jgi:probable F420-dependent oxidoreductase
MRIGLTAYDIAAPAFNELAIAADRAGFASLWLGEHVVLPVAYASEHPSTALADAGHITGPVVAPDTELVDPLVQLGSAAALTTRIELATGIFVVPLRHPLAVARSTCTVQELASGRFVLGVGFGWLQEEFAALDVPFRERVSRFEEALDILRIAWRGGSIEHSGRHFRISGVQVTSRPTAVPLILGGNSEPALDRAVRRGDGWFASGTPTFEAAVQLKAGIERRHADSPRQGEPFRVIFRLPDINPRTVARYAEAGFEEVLVWADQVWDVDAPADERADRLAETARRLGCTGRT